MFRIPRWRKGCLGPTDEKRTAAGRRTAAAGVQFEEKAESAFPLFGKRFQPQQFSAGGLVIFVELPRRKELA